MTTSTDAVDHARAEYERLLREAIAALTRATQFTWPAHTRTAADGTETSYTPAPVDAAEVIVSAVTGVAANAGTVDQLMEGRAGSWEADVVRKLIASATGGDERLLAEHRTAPITVRVSAYDLLAATDIFEEWQREEEATVSSIMNSVGPMAVHDGAVDDQVADAQEHYARRRREALTSYSQQLKDEVVKAARARGYTVPVTVDIIDHGIPTPGTLEAALVEEALQRVDIPRH